MKALTDVQEARLGAFVKECWDEWKRAEVISTAYGEVENFRFYEGSKGAEERLLLLLDKAERLGVPQELREKLLDAALTGRSFNPIDRTMVVEESALAESRWCCVKVRLDNGPDMERWRENYVFARRKFLRRCAVVLADPSLRAW